MLSKSGIIYIFERDANGKRYVIPVEETPDDLEKRVEARLNQNKSKFPTQPQPHPKSASTTPYGTNQKVTNSPIPIKPTFKPAESPIVADKPVNPVTPVKPVNPAQQTNLQPKTVIPKTEPQITHTPFPPRSIPNPPPRMPKPFSGYPRPVPPPPPAIPGNLMPPGGAPRPFPRPNRPFSTPPTPFKAPWMMDGEDEAEKDTKSEIEALIPDKIVDPREKLASIAFTPIPAKPKYPSPFGMPPIGMGRRFPQSMPAKPVNIPPTGNSPALPVKPEEAQQNAPVIPDFPTIAFDPSDSKPDNQTTNKFQPLIPDQKFPSTKQTQKPKKHSSSLIRNLGLAILIMSLGGMLAPFVQKIRLETGYRFLQTKNVVSNLIAPKQTLPPAVPVVLAPLVGPDGKTIEPVNTSFGIIIPKIGVNAPVAPNVDPGDSKTYNEILEKSVAHAKTSFTPDQAGTVYLFSHSTNYDWFVKDLNAVFYLVKNLEPGDLIVLYYKDVRYTYALTEKRVVSPKDISYLVPSTGKKSLILQTCWPPGSVVQRLLLFADLVDEQGEQI